MRTYVVRVFDDADAGVRGVVRRVADGTEATFTDRDELIDFMTTRTGRSTDDERPATAD
jgi:hypothetical protein